MNLHAPQSVEAATELREIAAVPLQIVSPRESVPIVSVVQDTLVGANRFARSETLFTKKEAMNLLVHAKAWDGVMPPPSTIVPQPLWSGQQLLGCLLPPVTLSMKNNSDQVVEIYQGKINPTIIENGEEKPNGRLDKKVFSKQLLHIIYNDYGPDVTVTFLDNLQAMIANFLMNNGFSVGISDLIADDETMTEIREAMKKLTNSIETQILQIHTGLFENTSGRSNQEEFESKVMGTLNKAVGDAGKIGLKSLADTNRMTNMVKAGSKGSDVNVSQMIAVLGQQAIEGKRVPNGFQHRTLPHFKRFDDSARARGFIASSYITGLQPDEFFFHAMSGREGLIDTAVKSVTADTPIVVMENGVTKYTQIGPWIDAYLAANTDQVERFAERNLEMFHFEHAAYIPTVTMSGEISWGKLAAVTRHDPGMELYKVCTHGGRTVIVTESKSLIVWNPETKKLEQKPTPDVKVGDCLPVTMNLPTPPHILKAVDVSNYLPKTEYLYGTEYIKSCTAIDTAMEDRERIPAGWWEAENGSTFTLPYDSKARLTRARSGRSDMDHIQAGFVYPFTTNRENGIPDQFVLTAENGVFLGLYLAEGNSDVPSGYVQITNNDTTIRAFAKSWFESNSLATSETVRTNAIGGTSSDVRCYSTLLAQFLDSFVGHGARNKRIPAELFSAPEEFIVGVLNGYFSGDGTITENSVEVGSASYDLVEGINMLLSRLGMFGRISKSQLKSNNVGTGDIAPTHRLSIRAQWASIFAKRIPLIDAAKQARLRAMLPSESHRNFDTHKDIVLDAITEITILDAAAYPKVYDLTIPETFTFGLANGLQVYDTADTGYMQRRIRVALEDLITQHDGSVRDTAGNVLQLSYGEDGINATKLEEQRLPIDSWDDAKLADHYAAEGASTAAAYLDAAKNDRRILVEKVCGHRPNPMVRAPIHLERMIFRIRDQFGLKQDEGTVTADQVLEAHSAVLHRTHINNLVWSALVRHYLAPKFLKKHGFTKESLDALVEQIVIKHWRAWVEPGQPVGVLAAQSIGEPATQMTLNSVDWHTEIVIARDGKIFAPKIGDFIDNYIANCEESKIQHLPNDQLFVPLDDGHEWSAISCDENGEMMWTKLEAITRHPVINEDGTNTILEVTTESGRTVRATKARSFLIYRDGKIVDINGSDLRIGDELPVANNMALKGLNYLTELNLKQTLSPTEYMYDDELVAADEAGVHYWFSQANGKRFREAFMNGHNSRADTFKSDCVYPKSTHTSVSHIPSSIPLTREFGFFVGAYLAEGSFSNKHLYITNNADEYLAPICALLDSWYVEHHSESEVQGLIIYSAVLANAFSKLFGEKGSEKTIPDWVFQAPDEFVRGLMDAYFSSTGRLYKDGHIAASSLSEVLVIRMSLLLSRFGIFATNTLLLSASKLDSDSRQYNLSISQKYAQIFASTFTLVNAKKQERLNTIRAQIDITRSSKDEFADVVLDKVKTITEVKPMGGYVYDLTVEVTRNFTLLNQLCVKDTFHLAGVAAKSNMTRGVPRLKELLTATKNPKAVELTIPLRRDLRDKKEEARRVTHQLEFTMLHDIVTTARIYFDPADEDTLVKADEEWMAYQRAFEQDDEDKDSRSPWLLRIELDRDRMFAKNITMDDIAFILKSSSENGGFNAGMHMLYTDYNSNQLVFRMRLVRQALPSEKKKGGAKKNDKPYVDDLEQLKMVQNKLLANTAIRGVAGLRSVNYQKNSDLFEFDGDRYKRVEQYILTSDGSNFLEVLTNPDVDPSRIVSSSVHDMLINLGIEATRATLFYEITSLFAESGTNVNYRHVCILVDRMCHKGRLMSVDRYGINKNDIGPLAKMSFEQTEDIALRAAQFGERDPVQGISAKVMLGAPIRAGTAFSELLFDEQAAVKLAQSTPEQKVKAIQPQIITADEMNVITYGGDRDRGECGDIVDAMRNNITLPPARMGTVIEEPEGEVDLLIVDE
jgi:DNA-directed RNA polymerase beta' subunit